MQVRITKIQTAKIRKISLGQSIHITGVDVQILDFKTNLISPDSSTMITSYADKPILSP